jgi:hypothetical protein
MSWTDDWGRCSEAGVASGDDEGNVEGNVEFVTTSKLVQRMLERLVARHRQQVVGWFTGEEAYGDNPGRRAQHLSCGRGAARATVSTTGYPRTPVPTATCSWCDARSPSPASWPATSATTADQVPVADLVRVSGSRWGVEEPFQFTNNRPVWTTTVPPTYDA